MMTSTNRRSRRLACALLLSTSLATATLISPPIAHAASQEDQAFSAYANSRYEYCDAKMVGALWGMDAYAGKLRIGNKILYGIANIVEEDLTNSRQRGNSCNFDETGFSYQDAQRLSSAWGGRLSVWDAKTKIAAFVTAGQSSQIRAQMNGSGSNAGQQNVRNPKQEDRDLQAYANSTYNYCDAKMVAALWGWGVGQGKVRIGNKVFNGIAQNIEEDLRDSRQRGNSCNFNETEFAYEDAQRLSNAWGGRLSVWDAKTKIAAFVTAGQTSQIRAQMNGTVSGAGSVIQPVRSAWELPTGGVISVGDYLASSNGQFFVTMLNDGNLVIYRGSGPHDNRGFVWGSVQAGGYAPQSGNYYAVMQQDGNLVVYRGTGPDNRQGFVWGSVQDGHYTPQTGTYSVVMTDAGILMVYQHDGTGSRPIWQSGQSGSH
jgi:hypothetical protein